MLSIKNQKYIFDRLLKGYAVSYQPLDDMRIAFTDGVRVFIFSNEQIKFDVTKCAATDKLKEIMSGAMSGLEVTPTEEIREFERTGKNYRKLQVPVDGPSVWIEDKFVKDYSGCVFIYGGGTSPVCVLDEIGDLIAAIMPCDIDGRLRERVGESDRQRG